MHVRLLPMKLFLALLPLLLVSGCDNSTPSPARSQPEADLQLELEDTAKSDGLTITFEAVTGDSRCPEGVECVWAGEAHVRLVIDGLADTLLVADAEQTPEAGIRRDDVMIRAVALTPYPGSEGDTRGDTPMVYIDTEVLDIREDSLVVELGQTGTVAGVSVTYEKLEYESRCPQGSVCGTSGNAIASLLLEDERGSVRAFANAPGLTYTFKRLVHETDRWSVFLTSLSPYPGSEAAQRGDPLTAHLIVETIVE